MPARPIDETHDPARRSWVDCAPACEFPIQNLPLGIFSRAGGERRFGIAIGSSILDVARALDAGLLPGAAGEAARAVRGGRLNGLLALGQEALTGLRRGVGTLLDASNPEAARASGIDGLLHAQSDCRMHLPVAIGDFTDFYAGIHHARAAGALFNREDPLPPNYKHLPIAYHGRASSVRAGGDVRRPNGQTMPRGAGAPRFGPSEWLDFELELGFYVGPGNPPGEPIPIDLACRQIAGFCLLNDWSARDLQFWEGRPLGPFLSKSFATSVSPWVVTADALAPFAAPVEPRPEGDPRPLPYLLDADDQARGLTDIQLAVLLRTKRMREAGEEAVEIVTSNARHLFWTPAQMITHHASGGCDLRPGDLIGTGTISGPTSRSLASLLELTRAGDEPIELPNGEQRGFLADGDEITLIGVCRRQGAATIGFGRCTGTITA